MFSNCIRNRIIVSSSRFRPAFLATYATAASDGKDNIKDHHVRQNLHPWPKSKTPTPYEIFTVEDHNDHDVYSKNLKSMYQKYIKIYHPDISTKLTILDHQLNPILNEQKRTRFDQIQDAYDILKNPSRRMAYKTYSTTSWDGEKFRNSQTSSTFHNYRMANAHRKKYDFKNDEAFWQAGTWEDYYHMKFNRAPPTQEELDKNKYNILIGVLVVASLTTGLQIMLAIDRTKDYNRQTALMNLQAMQNMDASYNNYDQGLSSFLRLRRFLLFRRSAMVETEQNLRLQGREDEAEKMREKISDDIVVNSQHLDNLKDEEERILKKYAQQRLDKLK